MRTKESFTQAEADKIIALIIEKLKADTTRQKSIRAKIRKLGFWADDFGLRGGYTVDDFLRVAKIVDTSNPNGPQPIIGNSDTNRVKLTSIKSKGRRNSDENYIIDLCDEVLKKTALRQHRFDFLKGDAGTKLPVDAYYPDLNIVIEFREKQHTEEVKFFDKRKTVSGMTRGEQRKLYDQRRREILPKHGITVIELSYDEFEHTRSKKLVRNRKLDINVIKTKIK